MEHIIRITIDGPPVPKGRGRIGRSPGGRPFILTPAKTRSYESRISAESTKVMAGRKPFDQAVDITVMAVVPIPKTWTKKKQRAALDQELLPISTPDLDNYMKAAMDGMNKIVYRDDSLAVIVTGTKIYGTVPRMEITVRPFRAT